MTDQSPAQSPATPALRSAAEIATPNAGRYLQQLCKHFQHKLPATCGQQADARWSGRIEFAIGDCRLEAGDGVLKLMLEAPDEARMTQLQDVVARHLVRFAFREEMRVDWHPA